MAEWYERVLHLVRGPWSLGKIWLIRGSGSSVRGGGGFIRERGEAGRAKSASAD